MHYHPVLHHTTKTTSQILPSHYQRNMSHIQKTQQSLNGDHPDNTTSSVASPLRPVRIGISQNTRLPPISSIFASNTAKLLTPVMEVGSAKKKGIIAPSQDQRIASKPQTSSQLNRPLSLSRIGSPTPRDHLLSPSLLETLTRPCKKVAQPQTSSLQKTPKSYRSPNTSPPLIGRINGMSDAQNGNKFHIATMEGDQMQVNMAVVTSASTDNELVSWEPRKQLNEESPPLPIRNANDRDGKTSEQFDVNVLGKRSNPFSEKDAKKGKCSQEYDLAASLDALAREHARSSMSSSTISTPCSDSMEKKPQNAKEDYRGVVSASQVMGTRGCQGNEERLAVRESKTLEDKKDAKSEPENTTAVEAGNELDFLASVILSQNHSSQRERQIPASESQGALNAAQPVSTDFVHSSAIHDRNQEFPNEGENEPRSEASFVQEEKRGKLVLTEMVHDQGQGSTGIGDRSLENMENGVSTQTEAVIKPGRANESSPNVQDSSLRTSAMAQFSTEVGNVGCVVPKCDISYKLKRGPKVKRQKQDRVTTPNTGKARGSRGTSPKKRNQAASSSQAHRDPSESLKGIPRKRGSFTNKKTDALQLNRKSPQLIRSVSSLPSSKASIISTGGMKLSGYPSSRAAPTRVHEQRKGITGERKLPLVPEKRLRAESSHHENENKCHRRGKTTAWDQGDAPHSLPVRADHQAKSGLEKMRADHGNERDENVRVQPQREASSSVNVSADTAASPSIPLEVIIAAAKQSPPYVHKCDQCGSVFNRRFNLNKHIRNVHENIRKFACTNCGELFLQKSHLAAHVLAVHDKSRPFQCDLCPKSFSWVGVLRKHKQAIHKVAVQKRVLKTNKLLMLKAIKGKDENSHQIHRHVDDADRDCLLSRTQNKIAQTGTGDVVTSQKSTSAPLNPQCKL